MSKTSQGSSTHTIKRYPKLDLTKKWLRRNFPLKTPVIVKVVDELEGCHGICLLGDGRALIKIASASEEMMSEVMLEEYAHVLREECPIKSDEEHDSLFWAILATMTKKWRGE